MSRRKQTTRVTVDGTDISRYLYEAVFNYGNGSFYTSSGTGGSSPADAGPSLADAMAKDITALTKGFKGKGGTEMPTPERDLHTYRDAFESARENCNHEDARELLYGREWVCDDCQRMLNRQDIRDSNWSRWGG